MTFDRKTLILIAAGGSAAMMLGALAFQHLGDMAPCELCIWQRYPHVIAVVLGALALTLPRWPLVWAGALAAATTGVTGIYHTGVERHWWEGPSTCTAGPVGNKSATDLLEQIMNAPLIRCDEVAWQMLGLSMPSWNAVISFALAAIWIMAARKS